jgi:hypothetical protein
MNGLAASAGSVENDPLQTWTAWNCCSAIASIAHFGSGNFLIYLAGSRAKLAWS